MAIAAAVPLILAAGASLLIGRNRLTARPARIDLAYAAAPQPGRSRWLVSLGARSGFLD